MSRHQRRPWQLATLAAVVMAVSVAAPALSATPAKSLSEPSEHWFIPAGFGCSFDVLVEPAAKEWSKVTHLDDGSMRVTHHGNTTFTNWDSGASFLHAARFQRTVTQDTTSNTLLATMHGRVNINLWPGDIGPYGIVAEPGLLVAVRGSIRSTFDLGTGSYTAFEVSGYVTDVCAMLDGTYPRGRRSHSIVSASDPR